MHFPTITAKREIVMGEKLPSLWAWICKKTDPFNHSIYLAMDADTLIWSGIVVSGWYLLGIVTIAADGNGCRWPRALIHAISNDSKFATMSSSFLEAGTSMSVYRPLLEITYAGVEIRFLQLGASRAPSFVLED